VLSTRNLPDAKTVMADYLNMRDLLSYDTILMPVEALDVLKKHLG
jgi:large subunit ribosomal protein L4